MANFAAYELALDAARAPAPANAALALVLAGRRGFASAIGGGPAPVVTFVSPAPSSTIAPTTPIVVDVTDVDTANPFTFLFVRTVDGVQEVAWDGGAFSSNYATSTRTAITNGFRYALRRTGGWIAGGITIRTNAIDDTGGFAT